MIPPKLAKALEELERDANESESVFFERVDAVLAAYRDAGAVAGKWKVEEAYGGWWVVDGREDILMPTRRIAYIVRDALNNADADLEAE